MLSVILERLRQKYRTVKYPKAQAVLPVNFMGKPHIAAHKCIAANGEECNCCSKMCPSKAINSNIGKMSLDIGLCIFCGECAKNCPKEAITFTKEYRLAASSREDLIIEASYDTPEDVEPTFIKALEGEISSYFRRSLKIREVSAAGCNACEADCNVLGTIVFDLPRFGVDYVASPRHADAMLVTGPVPDNMQLAMLKCYNVMPSPKIVIAVGACAISGGLFKGLGKNSFGVSPHINVDLFIPGCPPNPYTILDGILRFIGKIKL